MAKNANPSPFTEGELFIHQNVCQGSRSYFEQFENYSGKMEGRRYICPTPRRSQVKIHQIKFTFLFGVRVLKYVLTWFCKLFLEHKKGNESHFCSSDSVGKWQYKKGLNRYEWGKRVILDLVNGKTMPINKTSNLIATP